jgi:hypothetical protein
MFELRKNDALPGGDPLAGLWYPIITASVCFIVGMIFLSNKKKVRIDG